MSIQVVITLTLPGHRITAQDEAAIGSALRAMSTVVPVLEQGQDDLYGVLCHWHRTSRPPIAPGDQQYAAQVDLVALAARLERLELAVQSLAGVAP